MRKGLTGLDLVRAGETADKQDAWPNKCRSARDRLWSNFIPRPDRVLLNKVSDDIEATITGKPVDAFSDLCEVKRLKVTHA